MSPLSFFVYFISGALILAILMQFYTITLESFNNALGFIELSNIITIEDRLSLVSEIYYNVSSPGSLIINNSEIILVTNRLTKMNNSRNIADTNCYFNTTLIISKGVVRCA